MAERELSGEEVWWEEERLRKEKLGETAVEMNKVFKIAPKGPVPPLSPGGNLKDGGE